MVRNDLRDLRDLYFEWLYDLVSGERFSKETSYRRLLRRLYDTEFIFTIPKDDNRAEDGKDLRRRFTEYEDFLDEPCSVLEMMAALAVRIEESIMDDPQKGDRTRQWFWKMVVSLGLGSMYDNHYDEERVDYILDRFLNREYEADGKGGLFTVKNCDKDLRDVEIWIQMLWYIDSVYM